MKFASEENDEKSSSFGMVVIWGYQSSLKLGNGTHKFGKINDVSKTQGTEERSSSRTSSFPCERQPT